MMAKIYYKIYIALSPMKF